MCCDNNPITYILQVCHNFLAGSAVRSRDRYKCVDETAIFGNLTMDQIMIASMLAMMISLRTKHNFFFVGHTTYMKINVVTVLLC